MSIENGNGFVPEQGGEKLIGWRDPQTGEFNPVEAGAIDPYTESFFEEEEMKSLYEDEATYEDIDEKNNDQWLQENLGSKLFRSEAWQNYVKELLKRKKYNYAILDPRPNAQNSEYDLGIEVTNPKLASLARLGNLDPQHGPNGNPETSAIEEAMKIDLPEDGTKMATIRPDMDSIGAMAVLELRKAGISIDIDLVNVIGRVDALGPRAKTTNPEIENHRTLTLAANQFCLAGKSSIEEKVQFMKELLSGNFDYEKIGELAQESQSILEKAKQESKITEIANGAVMVESKHPKAFDIGYQQAGIVVAYNSEFTRPWIKDDPEHEKWSIAKYSELEPLDAKGLTIELNRLEKEYAGDDYDEKNTWGGPVNMANSPQGRTPAVPKEVIIETVKKYIPDVKYAESHAEYQELEKKYSDYHGSWFGFGGEVWNEGEEIKRQKEFEEKKKDLIDEYRGKIGGIEAIEENIDGIRAIRKIVREQGKFPLDLQDTKRIFIALKKEGKNTTK